jgi:hypothetical protein
MNQADEILGYQLAEYKRSSVLKTRLLVLQLLVAVSSILSVFVENDPIKTYFLSISGVLLFLAWLWVDHLHREHRDAAERARRTTLVLDGLGASISPAELRGIIDGFRVTPERARAAFRPNYFASTAPPGARRVAEIVEESAYYTADLHSASAVFMILAFGFCMSFLVLTVSAALPFADRTVLMDLARMFLVFLLFALSSDVFGVIRGHLSTARVATSVYHRLSAAAARGYPVEDILLIVGDYNAAAESSPLPVPLIFKWRAGAIRRRWAAYQASCSAAQAQP